MQLLKSLRISGWKSIREQTLELGPLSVVVGANGSGKSNLLSVFRLVNAMFAHTPGLRNFVGQQGGADSILHFGARRTPVAEMEFEFETRTGVTKYFARWAAAAGGGLTFTEERVEFLRADSAVPQVFQLGAGHLESALPAAADAGNETARVALRLLRACRLFHFHDTSELCPARQPCYVEANRFLYPDAGNLAAMLYLFHEQHPQIFRQIVAAVRQTVPGFAGFVLEPRRLNEKQILLNWAQEPNEYEFGPHQLSDGSLRFIALATLLLQPAEKLPLLIALDEPELGLHPSALGTMAGMVRSASVNSQLILATQSAALLDYFEPEEVLVVQSRDGESEFRRLDAQQLGEWRENYSLGELWEKNVVGGGPYG